MRYLLVGALFLILPASAGAEPISFSTAVEVTISVAGTVPLAAGDLVIDDTFVLTGTGLALFNRGGPGTTLVETDFADFAVSGGGVQASGSVNFEERVFGTFELSFLSLSTPLYQLGFNEFGGGIARVNPTARTVFFSASSEHAGVSVPSGEFAGLVGAASFTGPGL